MSALAVIDGGRTGEVAVQSSALSALVIKASQALANAVSAAEVLDAQGQADFAYDASKAMAKMARARGAHDEVAASAYRAEADALEIRAMASKILAEKYEQAQERGEVAKPGGIVGSTFQDRKGQLITLKELGIAPSTMSRYRDIKNIEEEDPGFIRASLDSIIARGDEPTKAALGREINTRLNSFSGDNEWYTPAKYVEMAREVMGSIDVDPASNATAQAVVGAKVHHTVESNGLDKDWHGKVWMNPPYSNPEIQNFVEHLLVQISKGNVTEAIVLTNNSADTAWHHDLQAACARLCLTKGRIRFESPTRASNSPAMGQSFFYFGDNPEIFRDVFSDIGTVWVMA